ncbi:DUF3846 domain-containing protein [Tessaracoccus palaemonis]|uniref:DUF3846 domain-containing protein n=1 Tax=Tessaracoccus palaemonis TaxID=2829499 RepID=A0ABX8SLG9_9ACTN|nr:DUF3846 domain-containing protein [Tessaracoccus palaemonis]QXT64196.1 DUF3846 domain-containing protein [Tessaracoccus palaemonis]
MVNGIFVPAIEGEPEVRTYASLKEYQTAVGGLIEAIDVPDLGITIYINEEGLLRHLPFNSTASFLWWYHVPQSRKAMLVGDAVIVGMPDENGDSTDVPQKVVDLVMDDSEYCVLIRVGGSSESVSTSRFSSILLPLADGDPNWCVSCTRYEGYVTAAAWALASSKGGQVPSTWRCCLSPAWPSTFRKRSGASRRRPESLHHRGRSRDREPASSLPGRLPNHQASWLLCGCQTIHSGSPTARI